MKKVFFAINISADGYCGHTDMNADEEVHGFFAGLLRGAGVILFGRVTYQLMVPYWPDVLRNRSEAGAVYEFARVFDSLDKVVFSTTLKSVEGDKARLVRANLEEEVLALKRQPGKDIAVGSLSVASQLSDRGLIDEYYFVVHPVIVGKGPRLFDTVKPQERLQLDFVGLKTFRSGVVALHYRKHAEEMGSGLES